MMKFRTRPSTHRSRPKRNSSLSKPRLRFTPTAWAKWRFLRDQGPTEIAAFGRSSPEYPLLVEDLVLVPQTATVVSVAFDDEAVAAYFDEQVDQGRQPAEFARIWLHTHPGDSPLPSATDEATFRRVFGECSWSVMAILARGGASYARLQGSLGGPVALRIPVQVDWEVAFPGTDFTAWEDEYAACVRPAVPQRFADQPEPLGEIFERHGGLCDLAGAFEVPDWLAAGGRSRKEVV
jgi:proteasome lid subunit RPN8/RPN11